MSKKRWTTPEVEGVFRTLGLNANETLPIGEAVFSPQFPSIPSREIILTKLSDSSNPPPTGRTVDANMERSSR